MCWEWEVQQACIIRVFVMFMITVITCMLGSVHRPNLPLNSWTPMTANMKRRRSATTKMFPMFFTEATMHCTTCFRPAALLIALENRKMSFNSSDIENKDLTSAVSELVWLSGPSPLTQHQSWGGKNHSQVVKPTWEQMLHGWPQPQVDQEDLPHFCKSFLRAESVHLTLFSTLVRWWRLWWRNSQNSWGPKI